MLSLYVTMQAMWPAVTAVPLYVTMQAAWPAVTVRVLCNTGGSTTIAELQILMTSCLCNLYNKEALCNCNFLCPTTCDYHFLCPTTCDYHFLCPTICPITVYCIPCREGENVSLCYFRYCSFEVRNVSAPVSLKGEIVSTLLFCYCSFELFLFLFL